MIKQLHTMTKGILKVALASLMISCSTKYDTEFIDKWESGVQSAADSCGIRYVKNYYRKDLDFIAKKDIRSRIVQGLEKDWNGFKAIESFGDDRRDYLASILLDDSILYLVSCERESGFFTMSKVRKGSRDYEREIYGFEDFPNYKVECDSSANIIFYFKGVKY